MILSVKLDNDDNDDAVGIGVYLDAISSANNSLFEGVPMCSGFSCI